MKEINTLTIGFLFGEDLSSNEEIFTTTLDGNNLRSEYLRFEEQYKLFKKKNTNNTIPYKNSLENEECYIFFPEPVGIQRTTFLEVKLMAMHLGSVQDKLDSLNSELLFLKQQRERLEKLAKSLDDL